MLQNSDKIHFLVGNIDSLNNMPNVRVLPIFSDLIVQFFAELSTKLLDKVKTRDFMDVISYAFWIRKGHTEKHKGFYNTGERMGRGIALHFAPSNVPVNFAVSFTSALLAGNPCIVRVSNKEFDQVNIICSAINEIINTTLPEMQNYINIIRYEHDDEITKQLSAMCDIRIIWGGDRTINEIRKAPLPPRAIEMTFADRHSVAVINADEYLKRDSKQAARDFYTDTYYTDQNACSSPRFVIWTGSNIEKARKQFWAELEAIITKEFDLQPLKAVDKLDSFCRLAAVKTDVKLIKNNNKLYRVVLPSLASDLMKYKDNSGYFFEYSTDNLEDIVPILTKQCQTISYLGVDSKLIRKIVEAFGPRGVDRIVPMGQTMELAFIWDGYNMIEAMSRIIYVR